jgi:hypothetical protein
VRASKRFAVFIPMVSIVAALTLPVQAEELNKPPPKGGPARPGPQVVRPGPGGPQVGRPGPGGPQAGRPGPGGPGPQAARPGPGRPGPGGGGPRMARGPLPGRNFGGHAYHGHLAWEGGRWHHAVRNGLDGWWWDVGGAWYFYPQRLDGPPTYVSDSEYVDDAYADGPEGGDAVVGGYPPPPPGAYPPPPPPPPDPAASAIGGAIVGGILGGVLTGRPGGAAAGAIVGGTTGALVGATAASRPGYYLSQGGCYYRYPSGQYAPVDPGYCN